jgi:hypothetical protein
MSEDKNKPKDKDETKKPPRRPPPPFDVAHHTPHDDVPEGFEQR